MSGIVYLAGPITGLAYGEAEDWRAYAKAVLAPQIKAISPLRGEDYLASLGKLSGTGEEYTHLGVLSLPRGVMTRDFFDANRCDVLLVNLLGATKVSIGTVMEIAWVFARQKPIVVAMEPDNVHRHMMIDQAIGYQIATLDEALDVVRSILA